MTAAPDTAAVTIVTGAAGGIGSEVVTALAETGDAVALMDRPSPALWRLVDELASAGHRVLGVPVDVTSSADVAVAVAKVAAELGPVSRLVHAAGVLHAGRVTELSDDAWDAVFAVNAGGVFRVSRAVAPGMIERRRGAIVTITSNAAATPRTALAAYGASKAAATMFTKCLGLELAAYGIRCNVVAPGSTRTPMLTALQGEAAVGVSVAGVPAEFRLGIPLGRVAEPAHIADAVRFLLSDQAGHITMHELTVDGGATLGG